MATRRIGRAVLVALVPPVVLVGANASAWACTGQPQVFSVSPLTAGAGSQVTMRGAAVATTTPVELRWNGVEGLKLAEVTADSRGAFEMAFTVPDVAPGAYYLAVVSKTGGSVSLGRTTFEVSGASAAAEAPTVGGFAAAAEAANLNSPAGASSSSGLLVGLGMLAFGSVALGGVTIATLRKRHALAPASSGRQRH